MNSLGRFRCSLVAEDEIVNSCARRDYGLHAALGDFATLVDRTGRVPVLPNGKGEFGKDVDFNVVVDILVLILVGGLALTIASTLGVSSGLELANNSYIDRAFRQSEFVIAEGMWTDGKSRIEDRSEERRVGKECRS